MSLNCSFNIKTEDITNIIGKNTFKNLTQEECESTITQLMSSYGLTQEDLLDNKYKSDIIAAIKRNREEAIKATLANIETEMQHILKNAPRDSEGNLLAPNGKKSNLTERQWVQVRTKAFKDWFGDWENNPSDASKVVDENGEPLVVYRINTEPLVKGKFSEGFTYFTTDLEYAKPYARRSKEATLYSVFLNIKNPLDYRLENYENYAKYAHLVKDGTRIKSEDYEIENKLVAKLQKEGKLEGYDGIVGNDAKNWWAEELGLKAISDGIEYVTFNPNQIKSATDNVGTFSRTDDRIDYFETNNSERIAESQEALDILKKEGITLDNSLIDKYLLEVKASNPYHQIFKQIVGILNNNNIPINIVVNSNLSNIAARKQDGFKTATIEINPALLLDYLMTDNKDNIKENLMKILTHELVHAVTAEILNYHPSWAKIKNFNEAQTEFSNNVWNLYLQCKEQLKGTKWYGLTNAKEFIAVALTDRDFQIELSKIKLDKNENAFKRFINYLTDLFNKVFKAQGIDIKNSALEEIISISQEYFNSANKNLRGGIYDYTGTRDYYDNNESFTWDVTSDNSYEVSTLASKNKMSKQEGDARFSALNAKFKKGTIIDGVDVGGMTIEDVYQKIIKKSGKGKAPAKDSRLNLLNSDNFSTTFKNFPEGVTNVFYGADDEVPRVIFKSPNGKIGQIAYEKNRWRISRKQKNSKGEEVFYGETLSPEYIDKIVNKFIPNKFKEYVESGQINKDYSKDFQDNEGRVQQFFRENYNIHLINEYFFEKGKHETFEDFSYYEAYLPLWQEWARQNPELIEELRENARGKTLTDKYAYNTTVSQARALADILNNSTKGVKKNTTLVTKIISGGQTGVDTIGLQVAKELGIETGGKAPKGFLREEGIDNEDIASYGLE